MDAKEWLLPYHKSTPHGGMHRCQSKCPIYSGCVHACIIISFSEKNKNCWIGWNNWTHYAQVTHAIVYTMMENRTSTVHAGASDKWIGKMHRFSPHFWSQTWQPLHITSVQAMCNLDKVVICRRFTEAPFIIIFCILPCNHLCFPFAPHWGPAR